MMKFPKPYHPRHSHELRQQRWFRRLTLAGCCCILLGSAGCSDSEADTAADPQAWGSDLRVRASVGQLRSQSPSSAAGLSEAGQSRALVIGSSFGEGAQLGVTVTAPGGSAYTGPSDYTNIAFTSIGSGGAAGGQTWSGSDMKIKAPAQAVAYYPYDATRSGLVIPVETATQTDYMYSGWVTGLDGSHPSASFQMKHALAAIRINLSRGDYDPVKPCRITSVGAYSMGFGTSGQLDIASGELTSVSGVGDLSANTAEFTLPAGNPDHRQTIHLTVVPTGTTDVFKALAMIVVDGVTFTAPITMTEPFRAGRLYSIDLVANNTFLGVGAVQVIPWTETHVNGNVTEQ